MFKQYFKSQFKEKKKKRRNGKESHLQKKKQDLKLLINMNWFHWKVRQKTREFVQSMMILFIITTAVRKSWQLMTALCTVISRL